MHSLLDTKLCSKKKIGGCFKLKFSISNRKNNITVNDEVHIQAYTPIANESVVFVANGEITPPVNLKHSLGDLISSGAVHRHLENIEIDQGSCLKTLEYINRFGLSSLRDNDEGYSIFCHAAPLTQGYMERFGVDLNIFREKSSYARNGSQKHVYGRSGVFRFCFT